MATRCQRSHRAGTIPGCDGNKLIPKGRYTLYAIPTETKWTIIINRETDIWGAFKYDQSKDLARFDLPVEKPDEALEAFTIVFEKTDKGFSLVTGWDTALVSLPMTVAGKSPAKKPVKTASKTK